MKFRKKPVVIDAIQWTGENPKECMRFVNSGVADVNGDTILIATLEGTMKASKNDWIIKGVSNEFYPCKPDIFEKTYESASLPSSSVTGEDDRDSFAISFAIWALHDPQAKAYQEAGVTAYGLLEKYKNRPYINTDTSKQ